MDDLVVAVGGDDILAIDAGGEVHTVLKAPGMHRMSESSSREMREGIFSDEPEGGLQQICCRFRRQGFTQADPKKLKRHENYIAI